MADIKSRFDAFHDRVVKGDRSAMEDVCAFAMPELRSLVRSWPAARREPEEVIHEVTADALCKYTRAPERYSPAIGHPLRWLLKVAKNLLRDRWRAPLDCDSHEVLMGLDLNQMRPVASEVDAEAALLRQEHELEIARRLTALARTPEESRFLELRLAGAPFEKQAAALGGGDLALADQRTIVNRMVKHSGPSGPG